MFHAMIREALAKRIRSGPRAFTLVEMLIASAVTTVMMIMLWRMWSTTSQATEFGTWYTTRLSEMRTGIRKLREDVGKANYPTTIKQDDIDDTKAGTEEYFFKYKASVDLSTNAAGNRIPILRWYICKPTKQGLPGTPDEAGDEILCTLDAVGKNLHYKKERKAGTVNPEELYDKVLIHDAIKVEVAVRDNPDNVKGADVRGAADITVEVAHPVYPEKKRARETTTARVAVPQKPL